MLAAAILFCFTSFIMTGERLAQLKRPNPMLTSLFLHMIGFSGLLLIDQL